MVTRRSFLGAAGIAGGSLVLERSVHAAAPTPDELLQADPEPVRPPGQRVEAERPALPPGQARRDYTPVVTPNGASGIDTES